MNNVSVENIDTSSNPFIEHCQTGFDESISRPFFCQLKKNDTVKSYKNEEKSKEITNILDSLPLPRKVKELYEFTCCLDDEYYYGSFTFLSLKQIHLLYKDCIENNQKRCCDFGYTYSGMGHVCVWCYDEKTEKIFKRDDGGSNGYERNDNYMKKIVVNPDELKLYEFDEFLNEIQLTSQIH